MINDEILIREIAQIKAMQSVEVGLLVLLVESACELAGRQPSVRKRAQESLASLETEYENQLRADLGMPARIVDEDQDSRAKNRFDWPDILNKNDE